ncbi:hypothetical protein D3C83_147520 [compost metagenome]
MPVISETDTTRRLPSGKRVSCTTRSSERETVCFISVGLKLALLMPAMLTRRVSASRALLAWTVVIEPS